MCNITARYSCLCCVYARCHWFQYIIVMLNGKGIELRQNRQKAIHLHPLEREIWEKLQKLPKQRKDSFSPRKHHFPLKSCQSSGEKILGNNERIFIKVEVAFRSFFFPLLYRPNHSSSSICLCYLRLRKVFHFVCLFVVDHISYSSYDSLAAMMKQIGKAKKGVFKYLSIIEFPAFHTQHFLSTTRGKSGDKKTRGRGSD